MSPTTTSSDHPNQGRRNAELFRQFCARATVHGPRKYVTHLLLGELCLPVALSFGPSPRSAQRADAQMLPAFSRNDSRDVSVGNGQAAPDRSLRHSFLVGRSNHPNVRLVEFCSAVQGANRLTTLGDHISYVVGMGTKEKVIGIHARRIVAVMQDALPFGNWTKVELPRNAMRPEMHRTTVKNSVSERVASRGPNPATERFLHLRPEALRDGEWFHSVGITPRSGGVKWPG